MVGIVDQKPKIVNHTRPNLRQEKLEAKHHETRNPIETIFATRKTEDTTLQKIRLHYPTAMNVVSVLLHLLASSFPFIPFVSKTVSNFTKKSAIFFSRYIVPINMFHNAIEALSKKRLFEGIARLPVPFLIPFLPFFNFKLPYGIFAGINLPNEEIVKRVGELDENSSFAENNKKIIDGLKMMWSDLKNPQTAQIEKFKIGSVLAGAFSMLFGATGGLIFAPQSLNNTAAGFFGFIRALGGLIGDGVLVFTGNPKEKLIGILYAVGSFMDITQRWITNPVINELYNHAKTALDTVSTMLWTHVSTQRNMKEKPKNANNLEPSKTQVAQAKTNINRPREIKELNAAVNLQSA